MDARICVLSRAALCVHAIAALAVAIPAAAQQPAPLAPRTAQPERYDVSGRLPDVSQLPPIEAGVVPQAHPVKPIPRPQPGREEAGRVPRPPAAPSGPLKVSPVTDFGGIGDRITPSYHVVAAPSDTTGAVGDTQYVQWVNDHFAIFNKQTNALVYGPAAGKVLWQGFGGRCEQNNDGDPIVQYDRLARRWLMTQFAVRGGPPYYQCVAVSRTSDATGAYARYSYRFDDFNDYPKFGVWPDGYYAAFNMFSPTDRFLGAKACAFDRAKMLQGKKAQMVCFDTGSNFGGLLPSDLDGTTPPPAGSANYFLNFGQNSLNLWKFTPNWSNPSRSRLVGPTSIAVDPFVPACNAGDPCIAQPSDGGQRQELDSLGDRLMYRLAYRKFPDHESLVVNHSVDVQVGSGNVVGVRWYELRNPGGTPVVQQQGTFAPDAAARWIGSAAMDRAGNMLIGYSVSSPTISPSIRFTGREAGDPANTLASEQTLVAGRGMQTINRWGDYATLSVDPADDCTFWFTTEYMDGSGDFKWLTRIGHVKFNSCSAPAAPSASNGARGQSRRHP